MVIILSDFALEQYFLSVKASGPLTLVRQKIVIFAQSQFDL